MYTHHCDNCHYDNCQPNNMLLAQQCNCCDCDNDDTDNIWKEHIENWQIHLSEEDRANFNELVSNIDKVLNPVDLSQYYTKEYINNNYYTKSDIDNIISGINVDVDLSGYVTTSYLNSVLSGLDFETNLSDYITTLLLNDALSNLTPPSVSVTQILTSGTPIATINGTKIYAPVDNNGNNGNSGSNDVYVSALYLDYPSKPNIIPTAYCSNFQNGTVVGIGSWLKTKPLESTSGHIWMSVVTFYNDRSLWSDPIDIIMPEPDYNEYVKFRIVNIYKYTKVSTGTPSTPSKGSGSYNFDTNTLTAPNGWYISLSAAETSKQLDTDILWQVSGVVYEKSENNTWYDPIPLNGKVTEILDLTRVYVAAVYKESDTIPNKPIGGSYNFDTEVLTAPSGWSKSPISGENAWVSIRSFYNKTGNDSEWSEPVRVATANIDITALNYTLLALKITLTSNELDIISRNVTLNADQLKVIAQNISLGADDLDILAGKITLRATDLQTIANKITLTSNELNTIASKVTLTTELLSLLANNIDIQTETAKLLAKDNVFIGTVAGSVNITSQLNTKDINVGNGSCFFSGNGDQAGSGFVANGNIAWDKDGNVTLTKYKSQSENIITIDKQYVTITKGGIYKMTYNGICYIRLQLPTNEWRDVKIIDATTSPLTDSLLQYWIAYYNIIPKFEERINGWHTSTVTNTAVTWQGGYVCVRQEFGESVGSKTAPAPARGIFIQNSSKFNTTTLAPLQTNATTLDGSILQSSIGSKVLYFNRGMLHICNSFVNCNHTEECVIMDSELDNVTDLSVQTTIHPHVYKLYGYSGINTTLDDVPSIVAVKWCGSLYNNGHLSGFVYGNVSNYKTKILDTFITKTFENV